MIINIRTEKQQKQVKWKRTNLIPFSMFYIVLAGSFFLFLRFLLPFKVWTNYAASSADRNGRKTAPYAAVVDSMSCEVVGRAHRTAKWTGTHHDDGTDTRSLFMLFSPFYFVHDIWSVQVNDLTNSMITYFASPAMSYFKMTSSLRVRCHDGIVFNFSMRRSCSWNKQRKP